MKCLELYVGVAEGGASKEALAKACSAAGIMFNKLVSNDMKIFEDLAFIHYTREL